MTNIEEVTKKAIIDTINYNATVMNDNFNVHNNNFRIISKYIKNNTRAMKNFGFGIILTAIAGFMLQKQVVNLENRVKNLEKNIPKNPTFSTEVENDV